MHPKPMHMRLLSRQNPKASRRRWLFSTLLLAIFCWLFPAPACLADENRPVILRTSVVPEKAWVGQRVILNIDVLGENGWAQIPKIGTVDIAGAHVIRMESQGTRLQETINGASYTGQQYQLSIYPQRKGIVRVPEVPVKVAVKTWGYNAEETIHSAVTPAVEFMCNVPPGAENIQGLISTDQLSAVQKWEPDVGQVSVGETIQRTIELRAEGISAMAFTPLTFPKLDKADVYPRTPSVDDRYERGELTSRRTEAVTYFFTKGGDTELPAITIFWWDLKNKKLRKTVLSSRTVSIQAIKDETSAPIPQSTKASSSVWVYPAGIAVVLLVVIWIYRKKLKLYWDTRTKMRHMSEPAFFKRFVRAARSGNPALTLNTLMQWLDCAHNNPETARLDRFLAAFARPEAAAEYHCLVKAVGTGDPTTWNPGALINHLKDARKKRLHHHKRNMSIQTILPPLNPPR